MITSNSNAGTNAPQSENADVPTSSQNIANTLVGSSYRVIKGSNFLNYKNYIKWKKF